MGAMFSQRGTRMGVSRRAVGSRCRARLATRSI